MKEILSDIVFIDKEQNLTSEKIELQLQNKFGEIVRWAIIECNSVKLKISVSYIKNN